MFRLKVQKDGEEEDVSLEEWEQTSGVKMIFSLEEENEQVKRALDRLGEKLHKKRRFMTSRLGRFLSLFASPVAIVKKELRMQQIWRGHYYQKEIAEPFIPDVVLRWIDPRIGWGVFAARPFKAGEFIAEYLGVLRKKRRADRYNAYCFAYVSEAGRATSFVIDAKEHANIARYVNHSQKPNVEPVLATIGLRTHLILLTKRPIREGEQLCYDYGPDYWTKRSAPMALGEQR